MFESFAVGNRIKSLGLANIIKSKVLLIEELLKPDIKNHDTVNLVFTGMDIGF